MKVELKASAIWMMLARQNRTQKWLAERVGTTNSYLSQLMSGKRRPSAEFREKLMEAMNVQDFDEIFIVQE